MDTKRFSASELLALLPMLPGMLAGAIAQLNSLIAMFKALGMNDEDILAHIAQSEAKIDPLILRVEGFVVQPHPDDK